MTERVTDATVTAAVDKVLSIGKHPEYEVGGDNGLTREGYVQFAHDFLAALALSPSPPQERGTISLTDPDIILAGIKQFGLAPDGSDLRDLSAAIARLKAAPQERGEWRVVPVEATETMRDAGDAVCQTHCHLGSQMTDIWRAMLNAAPPGQPTAQGG